jgi:dTDP-4-dehydrorhamnose 3,5-epimerase
VSLRFVPTELPGVIVVEPQVHRDARGFFLECYHAEKYAEHGIDARFVQDNHSSSRYGTLRGLHGQSPHPQGKLVRALMGEVFDVVVDARRGSPAFGRFVSIVLSGENHRQVYVPPGLVHGFVVTSETAQIEYKCTDFYHPECEFTVAWDDPALGISWPVKEPILSAKDTNAPPLAALDARLIDFTP